MTADTAQRPGETLESQITQWALTRPWWQQWALKQFASGAVPTKDHAREVVVALVSGRELVFEPLAPCDFPATSTSESVALVEISNVANVNALADGQTLTFAPEGLTVVYGMNGSGKSGYARLVKDLVGGRHPERVQGNVFDAKASRSQQASVQYQVGAVPARVTWPQEKPAELRSIGFYDEHCGNAYLREESELVFRPSALLLLESLSRFSDLVRVELDARITAVQFTQPRLPDFPEGTSARLFLYGLSARTTKEQIDAATTLPEGFAERLDKAVEVHTRLQSSNPAKERIRLEALARDGRTVSAHLRRVDEALGAPSLEELRRLAGDATAKREAARAASERTFDDLPLTGVGTAPWRELWAAAEAFAHAVDPDHDYLEIGEEATCVLCQQKLGSDGLSRFERFRAFVADRTEREARLADQAYEAAKSKIRDLRTQDPTASVSLAKIRVADEALAQSIENKIVLAEELRKAFLEAGEGLELSLGDVINQLDAWSQQHTVAAGAIDDGTFATDLKTASTDLAELRASGALASARQDVMKALEVRAEVKRLKGIRDGCDTRAITVKSGDLESRFVTAAVRDQFIRETERLNLDRIQLKRTSGRKGRTQHRPDLLGASGGEVMNVLSEGEQTALSLAGHFTEAAFDQSKSALVFDDPVTSLDHERRDKVGRRLVELAADRQVIVFTHDMSFVRDLRKAAEASSMPIAERHVQRMGKNTPGLVANQHPWNVRDGKKRLGDLEERLAKLEKKRESLAENDYAAEIALIAGRLSQTWERMISNDLVGEVYSVGKGEAQVGKLKILARFTEDDDRKIQHSYSRVSGWAPRHDQPVEDNYTPPEPEDLREEIEEARAMLRRFAQYRT